MCKSKEQDGCNDCKKKFDCGRTIPPDCGRTSKRESVRSILEKSYYAGLNNHPHFVEDYTDEIVSLLTPELLCDGDGEYFDALLQKMICEVPQLRRLWIWKDKGETLQDNIKLGIVFDLMEHLHKYYQAQLEPLPGQK